MAPDTDICFYLARHGQTVLNAQKMFRGSANPALDETGLEQAHRLASLFKNIDLCRIFCSDKQRATKTAEIISRGRDLPVQQTDQLRTLNVGDFSGTPRNKESEARLQTYLDDPDTCIPGGESLNNFKNRVAPCFQDAIDIYLECGVPPLLVGHSSLVHELGSLTTGKHTGILVHPGGVAAAYIENGKLKSEPIFRPVGPSSAEHSETIS